MPCFFSLLILSCVISFLKISLKFLVSFRRCEDFPVNISYFHQFFRFFFVKTKKPWITSSKFSTNPPHTKSKELFAVVASEPSIRFRINFLLRSCNKPRSTAVDQVQNSLISWVIYYEKYSIKLKHCKIFKIYPSNHILVQCRSKRQKNVVQKLFKVNNKGTRMTSLTSLRFLC